MQIASNNIDRQNLTEDINANVFFSRYPDAPEPEVVETLDLNLNTKEEAMDILSGKKKLILKRAVKAMDNLVCDMNVDKWLKQKEKEGADMDLIYRFVTSIKTILKLHLYDYRDTWYLDVNISEIGWVPCRKANLAELNMRFGCKELLEEARDYEEYLEAVKSLAEDEDSDVLMPHEDERPSYYYFVVESIYDTNLVNSKAYKRDDLDQSIDDVIPYLND